MSEVSTAQIPLYGLYGSFCSVLRVYPSEVTVHPSISFKRASAMSLNLRRLSYVENGDSHWLGQDLALGTCQQCHNAILIRRMVWHTIQYTCVPFVFVIIVIYTAIHSIPKKYPKAENFIVGMHRDGHKQFTFVKR